MKTPDLSIVIPCYNEEKNIPLVVRRFSQLRKPNITAELVIVDNGSTDHSHALIQALAKKHKFICMAHVKKNVGYGFGVWSGLKEANGEYICWTHADMQTDLADTFAAYEHIRKQKQPEHSFLKGKRYGRPLVDQFFTVGMSCFETLMLGTLLYDINAQPNLFHKSFLKEIKNPPLDFSFDLYCYYLAKKSGYAMIRFPVLFGKRIHGESHWNRSMKDRWKFIKRTIAFTMELRKMLRRQ